MAFPIVSIIILSVTRLRNYSLRSSVVTCIYIYVFGVFGGFITPAFSFMLS